MRKGCSFSAKYSRVFIGSVVFIYDTLWKICQVKCATSALLVSPTNGLRTDVHVRGPTCCFTVFPIDRAAPQRELRDSDRPSGARGGHGQPRSWPGPFVADVLRNDHLGGDCSRLLVSLLGAHL